MFPSGHVLSYEPLCCEVNGNIIYVNRERGVQQRGDRTL